MSIYFSPKNEVTAGGAVGGDVVARKEITLFLCRPAHGGSGGYVVGRPAMRAAQRQEGFVILDADRWIDFDGATEVVDEGCGVLVGDEYESGISGCRGKGVGETGGELLAQVEALVDKATVYPVLRPHGLTGKFYPYGGCGYAVVVAVVAGGEDDEE